MKINKKDIFTISNFLSFLRLMLALPFWILIGKRSLNQINYEVILLCIIAGLTDVLDGYFARGRHEITEFGKIIDPLADKIVVGTIVIKLFYLNAIPFYYLAIVIIRDIVIFVGGIFTSKKIGKVLPSNILGKATVINIGILILLILFGLKDIFLYQIIFYSSMILMFLSLMGYAIRAREFLSRKTNETF